MEAILFFKMAANPPILDIGLSQPRIFTEICAWGLYPGFLGRRIDWNNYLSGIDKLYMKHGIHVFQKWLPFQPIFIISQPIEDIQLWFWCLYPGFGGRGIQWNNNLHIKMHQSGHGGHFVFQNGHYNPTNSWYRPISTQNVHRITFLGAIPRCSGPENRLEQLFVRDR